MHQALDALLQLDEDAEVRVLDDGTLDDLAEEEAGADGEPRVLTELLDAQGDALVVAIDVQDPGLDLVALLEAIGGVLDALAPGQVGDVDQPVDALVDADEDAEVGDVPDLTLDDGAHGPLQLDAVPGVLLELAHAEGDALVLHVHAEHDGLDEVADGDQLGRVLDPLVPGHLGDVDQALDAVFQLDEGAVVGDRDHLAAHDGSDRVLVVGLLPRIGPDLLVAEADPLGLGVELQHLDLDGLADLEHLRGVLDAAVGHVGDVEQAVDAAQVHEGAVVGDVLDHALHDHADLELLHRLAATGLAVLLEQDTAREHDVAALLVELDDLELVGHPEELLEVLHGPQVHLGAGQEGLDADVDLEAALDAGLDDAGDGLVALDGQGDLLPGLHQVRLLLGEDELTAMVVHRVQEDIHGVAHGHAEAAVAIGELPLGDGALGLVADVDDDAVVGDSDDLALHHRLLLHGVVVEVGVHQRLEVVAGEIRQVGVESGAAHVVVLGILARSGRDSRSGREWACAAVDPPGRPIQ